MIALHECEFLDEDACEFQLAPILPEHGVEDVHRLVQQRRCGNGRESPLYGAAHILLEHHYQQFVFGAGMKEKRPFADVGELRDFAGGGLLEALGAEEFACRGDNSCALVALVSFSAADDFESGGGRHARASRSSGDTSALSACASSLINLSIILLNCDNALSDAVVSMAMLPDRLMFRCCASIIVRSSLKAFKPNW